MADSQQKISQPSEMANVSPLGDGAYQTRQIIEGVTSGLNDNRLNDTWKMLAVFCVGFLTLGGLFISGYLLLAGKDDRMSDKVQALDKTVTRIEQKLDDLIARIPPVQTVPPRKN